MENELEKKEYVADLLLIYGGLLTENVHRRMEMFYLDDYSITEIAELEKVSRNAVFEALKNGAASLEKYEKKLLILEKNQKLAEELEKLKTMTDASQRSELIDRLKGELGYGI